MEGMIDVVGIGIYCREFIRAIDVAKFRREDKRERERESLIRGSLVRCYGTSERVS